MSKAEILAELTKLNSTELAEVQAKIDELTGDAWVDDPGLSDTDKTTLDAALLKYHENPDAGSKWEDVEARIRSKFNK